MTRFGLECATLIIEPLVGEGLIWARTRHANMLRSALRE